MKVTTFLILRRLSILAILSLLSIAVLIAQIKIHEKISISPRTKILKQMNLNSMTNSTIPLLYIDTIWSRIRTTRPCQINAFGNINYQWAGGGLSYAVMSISGEGWNNDW